MAYSSVPVVRGPGSAQQPITLPETIVRATDNRALILVLVLLALWFFTRGNGGES